MFGNARYSHRETTVTTDLKNQVFTIEADSQKEDIKFSLPDFARALVEVGGWVEYADDRY